MPMNIKKWKPESKGERLLRSEFADLGKNITIWHYCYPKGKTCFSMLNLEIYHKEEHLGVPLWCSAPAVYSQHSLVHYLSWEALFWTVSTILQSKYLNLSYRAGPSLFIFYPSRWDCPRGVWWLWSRRHLCSRWHLHAGQLSGIELLQNREDKHYLFKYSWNGASKKEKLTVSLDDYFSDSLAISLSLFLKEKMRPNNTTERKNTGMEAIVLFLVLLAITLWLWTKDLITLEVSYSFVQKEFAWMVSKTLSSA